MEWAQLSSRVGLQQGAQPRRLNCETAKFVTLPESGAVSVEIFDRERGLGLQVVVQTLAKTFLSAQRSSNVKHFSARTVNYVDPLSIRRLNPFPRLGKFFERGLCKLTKRFLYRLQLSQKIAPKFFQQPASSRDGLSGEIAP